ncbi:MAG TPA: AMMECR1 domain-containing protein [Polyangiaceae bacterium]|nr:AMMECR1 domain-containing protein [Polyangiaceae bacterium]
MTLARTLASLLRFQADLAPFRPSRGSAPEATPFVSLYVHGRLRGCYGSDEGRPMERVARAFLRAAHDARFGGVPPNGRHALVAQVSYARGARLLNPASAAEQIEVGRHGVAFVPDRCPPVLLLPQVARDEHLDAGGLLEALARKASAPQRDWRDAALYRFETQDLVVRSGRSRAEGGDAGGPRAGEGGLKAAAAWLASLVDDEGRVAFAVDARSGRRWPLGEMHHGRAAVVVQALGALGPSTRAFSRARRRLATDISSALAGRPVDGWPSEADRAAGTLALAIRAGLPLHEALLEWLTGHAPLRSAWHAAQVVAALGARAPAGLWALCTDDLDVHPFAPWTLMAARALGQRSVEVRVADSIARAIRAEAPHRGGASLSSPPEVAMTALAVEALAFSRSGRARAAVARGREFIASTQLVGGRVYGALDPAAYGAFPATPVSDLLRGDVTAHAVLAMLA